jgi:hypothetical protein
LLYLGHLAREEPSAYRLSRPSQDALPSAYHTDDGAKHPRSLLVQMLSVQ